MTAVGKLKLLDILLADIDGLLAVELLRNDEKFLLGLFLFLLSDEGHILAPSAAFYVLVLAAKFVKVFVA